MLHQSLNSLKEGGRVQRQGKGPHSGKQELQEGRQGLEEEGEENREKQVGFLQVSVSPGVWEEEWGTLWCLGGDEGGRAGSGFRMQEVGETQGHGHLSLPAQ